MNFSDRTNTGFPGITRQKLCTKCINARRTCSTFRDESGCEVETCCNVPNSMCINEDRECYARTDVFYTETSEYTYGWPHTSSYTYFSKCNFNPINWGCVTKEYNCADQISRQSLKPFYVDPDTFGPDE